METPDDASSIDSAGSGIFTDGTNSPRSPDSGYEVKQETPRLRDEFAQSLEAYKRTLDELEIKQGLLDKSFDERDNLAVELEAKEQQNSDLQNEIVRLIDDSNTNVAGCDVQIQQRDQQISERDKIINKQTQEQAKVEQLNRTMQEEMKELKNANRELMQENVLLKKHLRDRDAHSPPR